MFDYYDPTLPGSRTVEGTEDFVDVAFLSTFMSYDWNDLGVYYSPSKRRYFWLDDSGCSCSGFGDTVRSLDDFENGDRAAALRAVKAWTGYEDGDSATDRHDAIRAVSTFREEAHV